MKDNSRVRGNSTIRRQPRTTVAQFSGVRRFVRKHVDLDVLILDEDGWEIELESINISAGGVFVRSNYLFEIGAQHTLIIGLPGAEQVVRTRARVVRTESLPEGVTLRLSEAAIPGMAYEFVGPHEDLERLEALMEAV